MAIIINNMVDGSAVHGWDGMLQEVAECRVTSVTVLCYSLTCYNVTGLFLPPLSISTRPPTTSHKLATTTPTPLLLVRVALTYADKNK